MPSVRMQIADKVEEKLTAVLASLGWKTLERNPQDPFGEDQMNAIGFVFGGEPEPDNLTGQTEVFEMELEIGLVVKQTAAAKAEDLLDAGYVAVCNALLDPDDIQLDGLAQDIRRGALGPPLIGRSAGEGARIIGVQSIGFFIRYWTREGDVTAKGP